MSNINATENPTAIWSIASTVSFTRRSWRSDGDLWPQMKIGITTNRTIFSIAHDVSNNRIVLETLDLNLDTPLKIFVLPNVWDLGGVGLAAVRRIGDSTFLMADNHVQNKFFILDLANLTLYKPILNASLIPPPRMGFTSVVVNNSYVILNGHNGVSLTNPPVYAIKFYEESAAIIPESPPSVTQSLLFTDSIIISASPLPSIGNPGPRIVIRVRNIWTDNLPLTLSIFAAILTVSFHIGVLAGYIYEERRGRKKQVNNDTCSSSSMNSPRLGSDRAPNTSLFSGYTTDSSPLPTTSSSYPTSGGKSTPISSYAPSLVLPSESYHTGSIRSQPAGQNQRFYY